MSTTPDPNRDYEARHPRDRAPPSSANEALLSSSRPRIRRRAPRTLSSSSVKVVLFSPRRLGFPAMDGMEALSRIPEPSSAASVINHLSPHGHRNRRPRHQTRRLRFHRKAAHPLERITSSSGTPSSSAVARRKPTPPHRTSHRDTHRRRQRPHESPAPQSPSPAPPTARPSLRRKRHHTGKELVAPLAARRQAPHQSFFVE